MARWSSARFGSPSSLFCHHVDLAVERVAEIVGDFSWIQIEQQIAISAQRSGCGTDADSVLTAILCVRSSVYDRNRRPTAGSRINGAFRRRLKIRSRTIASPQAIELWSARTRMP